MENNHIDAASVLRIPPGLRSHLHLVTLMNLTKDVQFFNKISAEQSSQDVHYECCKVMTMEEYSEKDVIFQFGESGEKFYIILSGSVSVQIPSRQKVVVSKQAISHLEQFFSSDSSVSSSYDDSDKLIPSRRNALVSVNVAEVINSLKKTSAYDDFPENKKNSLTIEEKTILCLLKQKEKQEQKILLDFFKHFDKESIELDFQDFTEIGVLTTGGSFGELALLSEKPRSATIFVREKSSFLVLNKKDFSKILGEIAERHLNLMVRFLQQVSFFKSKSRSFLIKLAYFFTSRKFKKGQFVFREGDPNDGVFFIKEGEIMIEKKTWVKNENLSVFSSSPQDFLMKVPRRLKNFTNTKIVIKGKFECFGGFDTVEHLETKSYSALCSSATCEVLFIANTHFLTRVSNVDVIRDFIVEDHERILARFAELQERTRSISDTDHRSVTPVLFKAETKESLGKKSVNDFFSCRKPLPQFERLSKNNFLRKLTKSEVDEAVNGRKGIMRKYGSKRNKAPSLIPVISKQKVFSIHVMQTYTGSRCVSPYF
jgi:CRP-like cAMP-binding protein